MSHGSSERRRHALRHAPHPSPGTRAARLLARLLLVAAVGGGCGGSRGSSSGPSTPPALVTDNTITVGGVARTYDYYVPPTLGSDPAPMVILLHGGGGSADTMTGRSGVTAPFKVWLDLAEAERFVVLLPEGAPGPNGTSGWNDCRGDASTNPSTDDVAFIARLIDDLATGLPIDRARVYASGISNGGHMAIRLAQELSDRIAAAGVVAAGMPAANQCTAPLRPTSILFMNGTADPISPYTGGQVADPSAGRGTVLSTPSSVGYWVGVNGTDAAPLVDDVPDLSTDDGSTVRRHRYPNGTGGAEVVLYEVTGGGHTEPSIEERYSSVYEALVGRQNHDLEMAREVWAFLRDRRL